MQKRSLIIYFLVIISVIITSIIGYSIYKYSNSSQKPEANKVQNNNVTSNEHLKYLALGDSLAVGFGATKGYIPRLTDIFREKYSLEVDLTNISIGGIRSKDMLTGIRTLENLKDNIRKADIIVFDIGGNDFLAARDLYKTSGCGGQDNKNCLDVAVSEFKNNWNEIIKEIKNLNNSLKLIAAMDLYYPYVREDMNSSTTKANGRDFDVFTNYYKDINRFIENSCIENGILMAKVSTKFNGQRGDEDPKGKVYLSVDNTHPNDKGYEVIAEAFKSML